MTDKDLRRLSRAELLDILYEQRKRYEDSLAENQALRQQLEEMTAERDALAKKVSHYQEMEKEHGAVLLQTQSLSEQVAVPSPRQPFR